MSKTSRKFTTALCATLVVAFLFSPNATAGNLNQGLGGTSLDILFPGAEFDRTIPSQKQITGVEPGERPLRSEETLLFFRALADASPNAHLTEYARSHEGQPLIVLAISDEATITDLDGFKARHAALMDPRTGSAKNMDNEKAVAWMAYGIHGDELSSTDAAASLAYRLVAGVDEQAQALREKLVVLIDPNENPDGRARYLAQITTFAHSTANPDQDDLSHTAVWPWGRGNHYLFDLNRDWFTMVHPESARSREIAGWLPQIMIDSHEMGGNATYLFSPPRHPFNPHLPPNTRKWERRFSDDQATALDSRGYPYFTGEWNEEFFPGYGSSWASYLGAVGILYEMSRTSGTLVRKHGGTLRTFPQAVEHQVASSISNLETLARNSAMVLGDQAAARKQAMKTGKVRAWLFPPDPRRPQRLGTLAGLLVDQGIEVQVLRGNEVAKNEVTNARTGSKAATDLPPGTLLVRLDQPSASLARVLLDPHIPMESGFFQDEREYLEKGKGSRLYETTAWSLPLAKGIPAYWSRTIPTGDWQAWTAPQPAREPSSLTGSYTSVILNGDSDRAPRTLASLLQAGVTVRVAKKPFTIAGEAFRRGALVVRKDGNVEDLDEILKGIMSADGVKWFPVETSNSSVGPDLGGAHFPVLVAPRVGVVTGMPISPPQYGSIWHLLDQELNLRFSALDIGRLVRTDLSRYNVLIFPPVFGGSEMYRLLLGPAGVERLKRWINAGGTAIGVGTGARLLADKDTGITKTVFRSQALKTFPPPVWSIAALEAEAAGRPSATGLRLPPATRNDEAKKGKILVTETASTRTSPYDVAPILGPGARPFAAGHDQGTQLGGQPIQMSEWLKDILPPGEKAADEDDFKKADSRLRSFMPQGALLRADLDEEFWMNFGLDENITVWFGSHDSLIAEPPVSVAARFPEIDRLHLSGLLWPEAAARIANTGYATRETVGRGQVILFADQPSYRRWMKESERLLINAVLLGPGLGTRWSTPW
ncbi:MAG: hypothetical protein K8R59_04255 [Thermoanaerobaculales bacterium]|nr:hypothetical protein [Thermoanaerobaculales bacterium]